MPRAKAKALPITECRRCGLEGAHKCKGQPITESAWLRWFQKYPKHSPSMMGLRESR